MCIVVTLASAHNNLNLDRLLILRENKHNKSASRPQAVSTILKKLPLVENAYDGSAKEPPFKIESLEYPTNLDCHRGLFHFGNKKSRRNHPPGPAVLRLISVCQYGNIKSQTHRFGGVSASGTAVPTRSVFFKGPKPGMLSGRIYPAFQHIPSLRPVYETPDFLTSLDPNFGEKGTMSDKRRYVYSLVNRGGGAAVPAYRLEPHCAIPPPSPGLRSARDDLGTLEWAPIVPHNIDTEGICYATRIGPRPENPDASDW